MRIPGRYVTGAVLLASATVIAVISACGGGGGGGGGGAVAVVPASEVEPNNTAATATPTGASLAGAGSLATAGDADFWSFNAAAGTDIEIELFAARRAQAAWSAPGNLMVATLIAPDGTTTLVKNTPLLGVFDIDIPTFHIAASGTHFLKLEQSAPGNAAGTYAFTVKTVGLSNLQTEAEAPGVTGVNDTSAGAQAITPGTVFGYHGPSNFDFYSFNVAAPSIVRLATTAYRIGTIGALGVRYDPIIDLIATNGTTVLKSDDDDILLDSGLAYQINTPGTYFLNARHFNTAEGPYYLSYESVPVGSATETEPNNLAPGSANPIAYGSILSGSVVAGDDDFFSFTGTAGDMVYVQVLSASTDVQGSLLGTLPTSSILQSDGVTVVPSAPEGSDLRFRRTILTASGTYFIRLTTASGTALPYTLRLIRQQSSGLETEPNNTIAAANPIPAGNRVTGVIATAGDLDTYSFSAAAGELVVFSVEANSALASNLDNWGSTLITGLQILDGTAAVLGTSNTTSAINTLGTITGLRRVEIAFVAPGTGTFYVQVSDTTGAGNATKFYTLVKR